MEAVVFALAMSACGATDQPADEARLEAIVAANRGRNTYDGTVGTPDSSVAPESFPTTGSGGELATPAHGVRYSVEDHPWMFAGDLLEDEGLGCAARFGFTFGRITDLGDNDSRCMRQVGEEEGNTVWSVICPVELNDRGSRIEAHALWIMHVARTPTMGRDGRTPIYPALYAQGTGIGDQSMTCSFRGYVLRRVAEPRD